ncbi:MAG: hypothetical protein J0M08_12880 [Bacteroidetes bacterium]|nr:hypothetical protein [Bacteroidota bacterium]
MRLAKKLMFVLIITNIGGIVIAQTTTNQTNPKTVAPEDTANVESKWPTIGVGAGVLVYFGDLNKGDAISQYSHIRAGYHINVEKRFNAPFGVGLNLLVGKLALSQRSNDPAKNLNFESPITQIGIAGYYHLDDNRVIKRSSEIAPYVGVGVSMLKFNPKGDLLDANGNPYHYWTDGSIRDQSQATSNYFESNTIKRDYKYETELKDSATSYPKTTITIPLTLGSRFQFNENWHGNAFVTYNLVLSDYIDNNASKKGNDAFLHTGFSVIYSFPLKVVDAPIYQGVDLLAIDKLDSDGDGVRDAIDECLDTPEGVKVNSRGCPKDDDLDGVPDYMDKEPNTKRGAFVDDNGVAISELKFEQKMAEYDSGINRSNLSYQYGDYDKNKDGFFTAEEMKSALDDFFAGKSKLSVEAIQQMIAFYLRQ